MKKTFSYILLSIIMLMPALSVNAQQAPQNRENTTIIGDALNQLPANDSELFNRLMKDIVSTGQEGLEMLISFLEQKNEASLSAEYAIDGLCAYASADSFDPATREMIAATIKKAADRNASAAEPDGVIAGFYERQLKRLGVITAEPVILNQTTPKNVKTQVRETVAVLRKGDRQARFKAFYAITEPEAFYTDFAKVLPKLEKEALIDVLWWMGEQKDIANEQVILPYIKSEDTDIAVAAAWALTKIGSAEGMEMTANFLLSADPEIVAIGEECLNCSRGPVADVVSENFKLAPPAGKAASLRLLAQRRSFDHQNLVFINIESDNSDIRAAAYAALKSIVKESDLDKLYTILEETAPANQNAVCEAIIAAASGKSNSKQYDMFTARQSSAAPEKQNCYIPLLLRTGNISQLFTLCQEYKKSGNRFFGPAFDACIAAVNGSSILGAQKLLLAENAMEIAETDAQRNMALKAVSGTGEYAGITYAGKYIDTPALQAAAAEAIATIALAHPEFGGAAVTELLEKVITYLETDKPRDYEYTITSIRKYINETPSGEGFTPAKVEPVTLSPEEQKEGFVLLFDGTSMDLFKGNLIDYTVDNGTIHVAPTGQGFGNLYVDDEFADFVFRFEFKLTHGANNGVGIRCEENKDAAYYGMEIQILDHFDPIYKGWLKDYQHHGSVYGIIPAKVTTALKPVGEWNCEEIYAKGSHIRVTVNGVVINEGDIVEAAKNGTYDGKEHPGLFNKSGLIGFLGHGSELWIRNVRVKKIK